MQLITEKILIPKERPPLSRSRLIELLGRSTEMYSTTIISGRTGTGKTLLATDFARHCGRRVAWYSVDATDKDPHFFFGYLLESLRQIRPSLQFPYLARLTGCRDSDLEQLAEAIIYELQETEAVEPLRLAGGAALDGVDHLATEGEDLFRVAIDDPPDLGEHEPPTLALEQLLTHGVLEHLDLRRDRGMRQMELLASPRDRAFPGDHPEVVEVVIVQPFHGR